MNLELPQDRLATTDAMGKRVYLYPTDVKGKYKTARTIVHTLLMALFLVLPWVTINGKQALLLNIAERRFSIFGLSLWAHDAPLLFFLMLSFTLAIAFITALYGRVWCGWACPQTVFIEAIFRKIERLVEGSAREQRILDQGPWNGDKIFKKSIKWTAFLCAAAIVTHSFLAYFVGSDAILTMITTAPSANWTSFLVIVFTTTLILFDFGWFREQFCTIICPYGRFQSVLMDSHSLLIAYDLKRGEPRKGSTLSRTGDCVNCFKCVQVCPTGIDIRRGTQLECIACTACADACDVVMRKTKKPTGLIRYTSLRALRGQKSHWLRPRTIGYALLLSISLLSFGFALGKKQNLVITILRAKDIPYQEFLSEDGTVMIVNHLLMDLGNQESSEVQVTPKLSELALRDGFELVIPFKSVSLAAGESKRVDFFIRFPKTLLRSGKATVTLNIIADTKTRPEELQLIGPY